MQTSTKLLILDIVTAATGVVAATMVATKVDQPYLWFAFPTYVVSATCAAYASYVRKSFPLMGMFLYYMMIDSVGIWKWYPW